MNGKTNKSFTKRLKVTKNGKVLRRKAGINHFQAKKSGGKKRSQKQTEIFIIKPKLLSRLIDN